MTKLMCRVIWACAGALWVGGTAVVADEPAAKDGRTVAAQVDGDRLLADLKALPVKRSPNASKAHAEGLRATEELIIDRLTKLGYTPTLQEIDFLGSSREGRKGDGAGEGGNAGPSPKWRNIIVELPGTTRAHEVMVLGAHFDAVPQSPGADDNGTGTVALLEAARVLKGCAMQRTVRLAFFNLEEVGLVGSRAYVDWILPEMQVVPAASPSSTPTAEAPGGAGAEEGAAKEGDAALKRRIMGMVSLDGIGYFTDEPNSQTSPIPPTPLFTPPTVGDFLALGGIAKYRYFSQPLVKAMERTAPELKLVAADFLPVALPDLLRSDHAPFMAKGVPAVILADTANFRSPHYHEPTDTVETIDLPRFTLVTRAIIGAVYELAGPEGGTPPSLMPAAKPKFRTLTPDPEKKNNPEAEEPRPG